MIFIFLQKNRKKFCIFSEFILTLHPYYKIIT